MKSWLKTELHTHTIDDPKDGKRIVVHSAHQLIDKAAEQGFQVLSITNHNQLLFTSALEQYARERGILLIPGVEATLEGKHVLLYNFLNYDGSWSSPEIASKHKGPDQLVIAPHPFFPHPTALGKRMNRWCDLFDAIEYNHFYLSWLNFNRRAQELAQQLNLPLVGNSDVHWMFQLGRTYSLVYAEHNTGSVLNAIKQGHVRLVTKPVSSFFVARWFGLNALGKSQYAMNAVLSVVQQRLWKGVPQDAVRP
jgi:predicted metal-dependent phosphoesterase TrpH